jgi:hypothetical protein
MTSAQTREHTVLCKSVRSVSVNHHLCICAQVSPPRVKS